MTNVLGFKLEAAVAALREEEYSVDLKQVRSRKGVPDGNDSRVLRQKLTGPKCVELTYAVFRTKPEEANA